MPTVPKYTFCLMASAKTRYVGGRFDAKTRQPRYEIEIIIPHHVREQVEVNQFMLGTEENCQWAWDIRNRSDYPAFVVVKRDGQTLESAP